MFMEKTKHFLIYMKIYEKNLWLTITIPITALSGLMNINFLLSHLSSTFSWGRKDKNSTTQLFKTLLRFICKNNVCFI